MPDIIISVNSRDVEALELAIALIKEKDELKKGLYVFPNKETKE